MSQGDRRWQRILADQELRTLVELSLALRTEVQVALRLCWSRRRVQAAKERLLAAFPECDGDWREFCRHAGAEGCFTPRYRDDDPDVVQNPQTSV